MKNMMSPAFLNSCITNSIWIYISKNNHIESTALYHITVKNVISISNDQTIISQNKRFTLHKTRLNGNKTKTTQTHSNRSVNPQKMECIRSWEVHQQKGNN